MTAHPAWCDRDRCVADRDGTVIHVETEAETPTQEGLLSVGLIQLDADTVTTLVDLRFDRQHGGSLTLGQARWLQDRLGERITLADGIGGVW